MTPDDFSHILNQVPDEQRHVLERMVALRLVSEFGWNDTTKFWAIRYTPKGAGFLRLLRAITSPEPDHREASLIAIDLLADGKGAICGFSQE
jgi:hypothetical protein